MPLLSIAAKLSRIGHLGRSAIFLAPDCKIRSVPPRPESSPLSFEKARQIVIDRLRSSSLGQPAELVDISAAHSRVLAENVAADRDYPPLRRSLRDGYAVYSGDLPGVLTVKAEVRAGDMEQPPLTKGEAREIMTGAPVPEGADAVVMVEHVTSVGEWTFYTPHSERRGTSQVKIERAPKPGQFINARGAEAHAGFVLIPAGTRVDASHVATLAMVGAHQVKVLRRPRVAILATGDEIVQDSMEPAPHQIRNSNSFMLATLVRNAGGDPSILPVAPDSRKELRSLLERGLQSDLLIVTGGVSAGKYDLVKPGLRDFGVDFHFERVRVQPGQPTAFGTLDKKPVFGLPGNPGSTLITFQLFAKAAVQLLGGETDPVLPLLSAEFEAPFHHNVGLTRFLPARLSTDGKHLRHIPWQGSSDIPALAKANAFLVADHDRESWQIGDSIRVMLKP